MSAEQATWMSLRYALFGLGFINRVAKHGWRSCWSA